MIVACLGLPAIAESEGYDRTHMDLPPAQLALLAALAEGAPGVPVVAVLFNGSAVRHQQLGGARGRASSSAGWAGRPAGRRSPTCSPAR